MAVIWVLEKPREGATLSGYLQGDFPVRCFASLKNFLRLAPQSAIKPDCVVVRGDDFSAELSNLQQIIALKWPGAEQFYSYAKEAPPLEHVHFFTESHIHDISFLMQSVLKHSEGDRDLFVKQGELSFDNAAMLLRVHPESDWIKVTAKEFQILKYLMRFQNRFVSHEDLCKEIWKDIKVSPKSVSSHVSRLRKYLDHSAYEIESIYGGGYRLSYHHTTAEDSSDFKR